MTTEHKTHLRNRPSGIASSFPACHVGTGERANWLTVSAKEFKTLSADHRCKKCEQVFLKRRNNQRMKNGKAPVKVWNEAFR